MKSEDKISKSDLFLFSNSGNCGLNVEKSQKLCKNAKLSNEVYIAFLVTLYVLFMFWRKARPNVNKNCGHSHEIKTKGKSWNISSEIHFSKKSTWFWRKIRHFSERFHGKTMSHLMFSACVFGKLPKVDKNLEFDFWLSNCVRQFLNSATHILREIIFWGFYGFKNFRNRYIWFHVKSEWCQKKCEMINTIAHNVEI